MAEVEHSAIPEADLHENKGASTASDDFVATVTSGATVWKKITDDNIDTTSVFNVNKAYLHSHIVDISTNGIHYVVVPFGGTLTAVYSVIDDSIATADTTLTIKDNGGNTAGTITIAYSGSAGGDIDSVVPVANNTFTAGQKLSIATDGASTNTVRADLTLVFTITA